MNKFANSAKKQTTLSPVMENRTKVTTKDIKEMYPDGVTITEFDFITVTDQKGTSTFPVFAIKEDDAICFFGGEVLCRIATDWANLYDGSVTTASEELKKAGGVKVVLSSATTKTGKPFTKVEVLD